MPMMVFEAAQDDDRGEPIPFALKFTWKDGREEVLTFHAVPKLDASLGMLVSSLTTIDEQGRQQFAPPNVREFFAKALLGECPTCGTEVDPADDRRRFFEALDDPKWFIEGPLLGRVFRWLLGELGGRPTKPS